ncbi:MAG: Gfo/Idh/MocA family oxidoreductase, partial [Proteobacteria bacterium]|nr:Gfo/Idh/MocA family oxidoreductase [Pseudomonadota bacterium]
MKIAIIGCGKQAPKHIGGLRSSRGVEVVLVDADPALAQALAEETGVEWVETVQEVLDDPGVVAIDICTPVTSHVELIEAGLAAGKDFFCEKPLCSTSA